MSSCEVCGNYCEFRFCSKGCYYKYLSEDEFCNSETTREEIRLLIEKLREEKVKKISLTDFLSRIKSGRTDKFPLVLMVAGEEKCKFTVGGVLIE